MNRREFLKLGALIPFVLHLPIQQKKVTLIAADGYKTTITADRLKGVIYARKAQGQDALYIYPEIQPYEGYATIAVPLTLKNLEAQLAKHEHPVLQVCEAMNDYGVHEFHFKNGVVLLTTPFPKHWNISPRITTWAGPIVMEV